MQDHDPPSVPRGVMPFPTSPSMRLGLRSMPSLHTHTALAEAPLKVPTLVTSLWSSPCGLKGGMFRLI